MMPRSSARYRRPVWVAVAVFASAAAALVVALPWLPRAPDLYVHLLWSWEVMRCLAQGQLPVWLPDLNAGFGSPGIRLYSPLGPVLTGSLGLLLGEAGRGLRAAALLAAAAVIALPRMPVSGGTGGLRAATGVVALLSPMVAYALVGRSAWSEFLAVPILWWIIERLLDGRLRAGREGVAVAVLWLVHVPSALMAGCLGGASLLLHRNRSHAISLVKIAAVGGGLSAWHWLPLLQESATLGGGELLTSGIFDPGRNVLGSPNAHALDQSIWLGWVAVSLLAAILLTRSWATHPRRTILAVACVAVASPLAAPLWLLETPLQLLQFPWRWLLPATFLLVPALIDARARRPIALAVLLAPSLTMAWVELVRVPALHADARWGDTGPALFRALGANPLLVDAVQNRPPSFGALRPNLRLFGDSQAVVASGVGTVAAIHRWSPLLREVEVVASTPVTVGFRILDYPFWAVSSDGAPEVATGGVPGVVSCRLPEGRHLVSIRWVGNPRSAIGQIVAALTIVLLIVGRRSRGGGAS